MPVGLLQCRSALVSGGLAGLGGASQVMGVQHQLTGSLAAGYGYTGVVVATLGGLSAFGVLAVALLLGDVQVGRAERLDQAAAAQPDGRRPDLGAAADGGGGAVGAPLPAGLANTEVPTRGR